MNLKSKPQDWCARYEKVDTERLVHALFAANLYEMLPGDELDVSEAYAALPVAEQEAIAWWYGELVAAELQACVERELEAARAHALCLLRAALAGREWIPRCGGRETPA